MDPLQLQRAMHVKANNGDYDQPDVLAKLKAQADAGDPDAAARLAMLEALQAKPK